PNMAITCWSPIPMVWGQAIRSCGLTTWPALIVFPSPWISQVTPQRLRNAAAIFAPLAPGIRSEQDSTNEWRPRGEIALRFLGKERTARMPEQLAPHGAEVERDTIGHPLVRPQLIATDLDGTIIPYSQTHTGYVSPRTLAAFSAAHAAGIRIAFVTGRPMRWMSALAPTLGPMGAAIVSNGAIIYDMNTDTVLEAHPMDDHLVAEVTNELRGLYSGAVFGAETLTGLIMEPEFIPAASRGRAAHQAPPITADPVNSVAVQSSRWIESDN